VGWFGSSIDHFGLLFSREVVFREWWNPLLVLFVYIDEAFEFRVLGPIGTADGGRDTSSFDRKYFSFIFLVQCISCWARRFLIISLDWRRLWAFISIEICNVCAIILQSVIRMVMADLWSILCLSFNMGNHLEHFGAHLGETIIHSSSILAHLDSRLDVLVVVRTDLFLLNFHNFFKLSYFWTLRDPSKSPFLLLEKLLAHEVWVHKTSLSLGLKVRIGCLMLVLLILFD